jgi:transposase-like protein
VSKDDIIKLIQPGNVDDQFTEILRNGARALLAQAVEAEVADFLSKHADLKTADGHQRVVRHGHLPEREVMTGICPVAIRQPRVRDREVDATDLDRIRFSPSILPPYMRRSKSIETLLPILYLKGISTGDFSEALAALLGKDAAGLSASAIGRLKDGWLDEHTAWQRRDLSAKRYVYIWADGIHLQARLEDEKQCILVADRRDAGRPQGTGRLHRWRPRERAGLARSAARSEAARARRAAAAYHRRWRARVLEGRR